MDDVRKIKALIDSGNKEEAWKRLNELLTNNPTNEAAWLLAYSLAEDSKKHLILNKASEYLPSDALMFNQSILPSPLIQISRQLGHARPSITLDIYVT